MTPIAATSYVLTEEATAPAHRTEAFTWLSTGQAIGSAAGAALAGLLAASAGAAGALATLPGAVVLAVIVAGAWRPGPPGVADPGRRAQPAARA